MGIPIHRLPYLFNRTSGEVLEGKEHKDNLTLKEQQSDPFSTFNIPIEELCQRLNISSTDLILPTTRWGCILIPPRKITFSPLQDEESTRSATFQFSTHDTDNHNVPRARDNEIDIGGYEEEISTYAWSRFKDMINSGDEVRILFNDSDGEMLAHVEGDHAELFIDENINIKILFDLVYKLFKEKLVKNLYINKNPLDDNSQGQSIKISPCNSSFIITPQVGEDEILVPIFIILVDDILDRYEEVNISDCDLITKERLLSELSSFKHPGRLSDKVFENRHFERDFFLTRRRKTI